jgi:hypothetical protein
MTMVENAARVMFVPMLRKKIDDARVFGLSQRPNGRLKPTVARGQQMFTVGLP